MKKKNGNIFILFFFFLVRKIFKKFIDSSCSDNSTFYIFLKKTFYEWRNIDWNFMRIRKNFLTSNTHGGFFGSSKKNLPYKSNVAEKFCRPMGEKWAKIVADISQHCWKCWRKKTKNFFLRSFLFSVFFNHIFEHDLTCPKFYWSIPIETFFKSINFKWANIKKSFLSKTLFSSNLKNHSKSFLGFSIRLRWEKKSFYFLDVTSKVISWSLFKGNNIEIKFLKDLIDYLEN